MRSRLILLAGICLPCLGANVRAQDNPSPATAFAYDTSLIAWSKEELPIRIAAARCLCHDGNYEAALVTLPAAAGAATGEQPDPQAELAVRERERVAEVIRLRTLLLQRTQAEKQRLAPLVDGKRRGGRLVDYTDTTLTLLDDKGTFEVPMSALSASNLENELMRHRLLQANSWQAAWLRWLTGEEATKALGGMQDPAAEATALRSDLAGKLPLAGSEAATALAGVLTLTPATEPGAAYQQMDWLCEVIEKHRNVELFSERLAGLKECLKALAQRAFSLADPRCLPCTAEIKHEADGRITATYVGGQPQLLADFHYNEKFTKTCLAGWGELATYMNTFATKGTGTELAGKGIYTWGMPLRGALTMELLFDITGSGKWGLSMATREDGAMLRVGLEGVATVWDPKSEISDAVGQATVLTIDQPYRLRVEFDGKSKVTTYLNDHKVAEVSHLGTLVSGYPALMCNCSMPMHVLFLKISGSIDPAATERLRGAFLRRVLDRIG